MPVVRLVRSALCGAVILGSLLVSAPLAMSAVYTPQQALPAETIQQFLADPAALLAQYPVGGPQMVTRVKDLAASDPATVDPILDLLKTANPDQSSAIGTALGQVALMAVGRDQEFATDLQTKVAQAGNTLAIVAFSTVVGGDIKLAAAGPGAGSAEALMDEFREWTDSTFGHHEPTAGNCFSYKTSEETNKNRQEYANVNDGNGNKAQAVNWPPNGQAP